MDLADVLTLLSQAGTCVLVMEDGRVLGLLTSENLSQFLVLRMSGMEPSEVAMAEVVR